MLLGSRPFAALSLGSLLWLAACSSGGPFDPVIVGTITAADAADGPPAVSAAEIGLSDKHYYRVEVPGGRDLLYAEVAGTGLWVRLLQLNGRNLAVSYDPRFFVGTPVLSAATEAPGAGRAGGGPGPHGFGDAFLCRGPCAALPPAQEAYLAVVENVAGAPRSYDLYVFTSDANDPSDQGPADNGSKERATPLVADGQGFGAIEHVGDADWFQFTGTARRTLEFRVLSASLGLELRFRDGFVLRGSTVGSRTTVFPGERFVVYSAAGRAGPSGTAGYHLDTTGVP